MTKISRIVWGLVILGGATLTFLAPLVFSAQQQAPETSPTLDTPARKALEKVRMDAWFNKRIPDPACPNCFKVNDGLEGIFESVPGTDHVISRDIPDPEPLAIGELRPDSHPETGEPLWYKGHQPFVGPTDEENVSAKLPVPMIAVKRIKYKYEDQLFKIPGVHAVGIGESGIIVSITPDLRANRVQIPSSLDGIPVVVQEMERMRPASHLYTLYRPVPIGAGVNSILTIDGGGSVGPHVSRDVNDIGACCYLYSLTAAHVLDPHPDYPPISATIYQPPRETGTSGSTYGFFGFRFRLSACYNTETFCDANGPVNTTWLKPDAAAIGHYSQSPTGIDPIPMASPCNGAQKPVRRMQYGVGSFVSGPVGIVRVATTSNCSNCLKNWGVMSHGTQGGLTVNVETTTNLEYGPNYYIKHAPVNFANVSGQGGDSGGLIAWNQTKDVVGMLIAVPLSGPPTPTVYMRLDYVKTAFFNAGVSFDHYWGTDLIAIGTRRPSNSQTDPLFPVPCSN